MKQPWWRRWWSYVDEVHIESTSSDINESLTVLLSKGDYQLCTPEAIYSYGSRYDNFHEAFQRVKLPQEGARVLILGLGLASIIWILEKEFKKNYTYTAVELDDEVIRLASHYVLDEINGDMEIISTDALHFMRVHEEKYDLIAVDVFLSDYIPRAFESEDFLQDIQRCLHSEGIVLLNRLYHFPKDQSKTEAYFNHTFKKIFAEAEQIHIAGNWMLVNDKRFLK